MYAFKWCFSLLVVLIGIQGQIFQPTQDPLMVTTESTSKADTPASAIGPSGPYGPKPPRSRPSGLPTFPVTGDTFKGPDFVNWIKDRVNEKKFEVALPVGKYKVTQPGTNWNGHINLDNFSGLTIWMDGVTLEMTNPTQSAFSIQKCTGLTMYGPTVYWDVPGFSQATITNVTPDPKVWQAYTVRFEMDAGYDPSHFWNFQDKTNSFKSQYTNPATGLLQPGSYSVIQGNPTKVTDTIYDLYITNYSWQPQIGYKLLARGSWLNCNQIGESTDTRIFDYTLLNCGGFGFLTSKNHGTLFDSLSIKPATFPPSKGTKLPVRSSSADGVHSADDYVGPTWDSCYFEALDDDAMAVHGAFQNITSMASSTITTDSTVGADVGTVVRFYQSGSYIPIGTATVTAAAGPSPWKITLDKLPAGVSVNAHFVDTTRVGSGFKATNNYVNGLRGRGIIAKGSNGIIDNNHFNDVGYAGVHLGPDSKEADFVHDVTVSNNWFTNDNYLEKAEAVIWLHSTGDVITNGNSNVKIINNVIEDANSAHIAVQVASNLLLSGNRVEDAWSGGYSVPGQFSNSVLIANNVAFTQGSGDNCVVGGIPSGKHMVDDRGSNSGLPADGLSGLMGNCPS